MDVSFVPKRLIRRISSDDTRQIHWNVLISSIVVLCIIPVFSMEWVDSVPHVCIIQESIGIDCPGCGVTRSLGAIGSGDLKRSLVFNPNGILIALAFVIQVPMRVIALKKDEYSLVILRLSKWINRVVIACLFIYWVLKFIKT